MNKYVERYVYDVTRRINENQRQDVKKELLTNIYDMLPDNPSDLEVEKVLKDLGKPREIAARYNNSTNNYLISPSYYDDYIRILKIAAVSLGLFVMVVNVLSIFFVSKNYGVIELITNVLSKGISGLIEGAITAALIVTIIFVIIERTTAKEKNKDWKITDLPNIPKTNEKPINKINVIVSFVFNTLFTVLFIYLIINHSKHFGWYELVEGSKSQLKLVEPLFLDNIKYFIIGFIFFAAYELGLTLYQLTINNKNLAYIIANGIKELLTVVFVTLILTTKAIINPNIFATISDKTGETLTNINKIYELATTGIIIIGIIIFLSYFAYLVYQIIKYGKNNGKN
ncbi:hypothetical protein [Haploplasma axanthum]|nr:hypothetical protein [Haploplasma axanthum]